MRLKLDITRNNMKFVEYGFRFEYVFVFKKPFRKVNSKISKIAIFSTGGSSEDGRHFILYKKNLYKHINTYGISYSI